MRSGENWSKQTQAEAEEAIGYTFEDKELLRRCFTHSSYSNVSGERSNERLEFLGDAVLGLCIAEELFLNNRSSDEGVLTDGRKEYVSQEALTESEKRANLMRFLRYSGGEENVGGKTPSNLFEAVVAGIYLDGGLEAAREFIQKYAVRKSVLNFKSALQELVQRRVPETPVYQTTEENGICRCTVSALGRSAEGRAGSKKAAEKIAAEALYNILVREES